MVKAAACTITPQRRRSGDAFMSAIDLSPLRARFPALARQDAGRTAVYFDGPGGTQTPQSVIDAMGRYLAQCNANTHGAFAASRESDAIIAAAHEAMADFVNAPAAREIAFGPNMTSLTFQFSRAIGRGLAAGDEVLITRLDHDANRAPWLALAERGVVVKEVDFDPADCTLCVEAGSPTGEALADLLTPRTRVVAVGYASNAVGTVNPIARIAELAHAVGALLWVDAVHYAPHGPIDVQALGCDFLVCSPYKFFGPHAGVVWGRYALLEALLSYKVRPAGDLPPDKFETGTQSHEAQAGVLAAVDYLAELGCHYGALVEETAGAGRLGGRRADIRRAMCTIQAYERALFERFARGLLEIPGLTLYGVTAPERFGQRAPTAAFRLAGASPDAVGEALAQRGIYVWSGNFYALAVTERLGLEAKGGLVRAGLVHYNTAEEVDYCLSVLRDLV
jgi:cysteine desulfurase family protein (TIGR01976 family)